MRKLILLAVCLLIPLLSAQAETFTIAPFSMDTLEIASNRHVQTDDVGEVRPFLDLEGFELVAQSDTVQLYLNREYHTLRMVDRRTGYIWGAIPLTDARNLNKSWKSYAASIVSIECFDRKNSEKRYGMADETVLAEYTMLDNGFACDVSFTELGVELRVSVLLNGSGVMFHIDGGSIRETGEFRLKAISFMPYLGSVFGDETRGWFLLPDGPGALMRFQPSGSYVAGYDKRIYGGDLSVSAAMDAQSLGSYRPNDYVRQVSQVLMPVYGVVHGVGQNGLLCVVEDGDLFASIVATPAGLGNTKYNSVMARFEMREKYDMYANNSGTGIAVPQVEMNELSPTLTVHLLAGAEADYDQMAVYYRNLLGLRGAAPESADMRVEILCQDVRDSYLPGALATMTTIREAKDIVETLRGDGVGGVLYVLSHYTKGNKAGNALSTGNREELAALRDAAEAGGGSLCLWLDPVSANEDQINLRLQAANSMSLSPIRITRGNGSILYPDTYFFKSAQIRSQAEKARNNYSGYGFAVDQLATRLYGDYTIGHETTRAENAAAFRGILGQLPVRALYTPNQSAFGMAGAFLDMPLVNAQYLYETDTVPFLPIVLSGTMNMYATSMNLGAFSRDRMLRMVEYGVRPSFTVTECESGLLAETPLADYYSTAFADWRGFIAETWAYMRPATEATDGKRILSHTLIGQGRVCVVYEDGTEVYVNYTDDVWETAYGDVQPHDYSVRVVTQ